MSIEKNQKQRIVSDEQISSYNTINPLLNSVYNEVKVLSKKQPDVLFNVNKVRIINKLLEKARELLKNETTATHLEILDEDSLPSNSDAVIILSLYSSALDMFHKNYYDCSDLLGEEHWK